MIIALWDPVMEKCYPKPVQVEEDKEKLIEMEAGDKEVSGNMGGSDGFAKSD